MEMMTVHVGFEVDDFEKAMVFWGPLLAVAGFARRYGDGISYAGYGNGATTLVVVASKQRRVVRQAPTGAEFAVADHIGFSVGRREDVDAIASAMSAAGVTPLFPAREYPEFAPGFYAVTFCDPDNNVIEFGHAPAVPGATRTPAK